MTKQAGDHLSQRYNTLKDRTDIDTLSKLTNDELTSLIPEIHLAKAYYRSLELTTKRNSNVVYGASATPANRYFHQEVASDICAEGRYYIKLMNKVANKYASTQWAEATDAIDFIKSKPYSKLLPEGMTVPNAIVDKDMAVYGDTDSIYIRGDYIIDSLGIDRNVIKNRDAVELLTWIILNKFDPEFDKVLESTITKRNGKNVMKFELELIGGKGIFAAKKKYIMTALQYDGVYVGEKGLMKQTGIELQMSGSSAYVHDILKSFINTIFSRWGNLDERTFFSMCSALRQQLTSQRTEDMAKINRLKKYNKYIVNDRERVELVEGSGASAVVKGAALYNHLIFTNKLQNKYPYLKEGMRVKWYYKKNGGSFSYPVDEFPYEIMPDIDLDIQLEKLVFNPIKRLTDGLIKSDLSQMGRSHIQFGFNVIKKHKK